MKDLEELNHLIALISHWVKYLRFMGSDCKGSITLESGSKKSCIHKTPFLNSKTKPKIDKNRFYKISALHLGLWNHGMGPKSFLQICDT